MRFPTTRRDAREALGQARSLAKNRQYPHLVRILNRGSWPAVPLKSTYTGNGLYNSKRVKWGTLVFLVIGNEDNEGLLEHCARVKASKIIWMYQEPFSVIRILLSKFTESRLGGLGENYLEYFLWQLMVSIAHVHSMNFLFGSIFVRVFSCKNLPQVGRITQHECILDDTNIQGFWVSCDKRHN